MNLPSVAVYLGRTWLKMVQVQLRAQYSTINATFLYLVWLSFPQKRSFADTIFFPQWCWLRSIKHMFVSLSMCCGFFQWVFQQEELVNINRPVSNASRSTWQLAQQQSLLGVNFIIPTLQKSLLSQPCEDQIFVTVPNVCISNTYVYFISCAI